MLSIPNYGCPLLTKCRSVFLLRRSLIIRGGQKSVDNDDDVITSDADADEFIPDDDSDDYPGPKSQFMNSITELWTKTPPVTQIYIGATLALTFYAALFNQNKWPKILNLDWTAVVTRLQFWRPITAFMFFGPLGLNFLLTIQFVWTYMSQLEKLNYNNPERYCTMILFGAMILLAGYTLLGLSSKFLGHNLSTYLVYIWARTFEGTDVNVMDLLVLRAELLPWFFCLQTLLLEGEMPYADLLGIAVGHLYVYLTTNKILTAPTFLVDLFSTDIMKQRYSKFKDEFE